MRCAAVVVAVALILAGCGKPQQATPDHDRSTAPDGAVVAAAAPTAAMGEMVFRRCAACHTVDAGGPNGIGPNLHGIVGGAVAARPGYAYSAALRAKGGVWNEAALDAFLEDPMKTVPGTRMAFAGVIDAADRQALILYLQRPSD